MPVPGAPGFGYMNSRLIVGVAVLTSPSVLAQLVVSPLPVARLKAMLADALLPPWQLVHELVSAGLTSAV